jgi:ribosomal protein L37AE/L43A
MTEEERRKKFEELKEKFIKERENRPKEEPKYPYELFGVECGDGWKHLYQPIIEYVVEYNLKQDNDEDKIEIHQIKEKFGGLRVYLSRYTEELRKMIDDAEEKSFNTCEICGKHIKKPITENHWIYAECDECHRKFNERQEKAREAFENKVRKKNKESENSKGKS